MTIEKPPTAELAAKVTAARDHLTEVRDEIQALADQMPTMPQMADLDMALMYCRHVLWLLGGEVA